MEDMTHKQQSTQRQTKQESEQKKPPRHIAFCTNIKMKMFDGNVVEMAGLSSESVQWQCFTESKLTMKRWHFIDVSSWHLENRSICFIISLTWTHSFATNIGYYLNFCSNMHMTKWMIWPTLNTATWKTTASKWLKLKLPYVFVGKNINFQVAFYL